MAYEYVNSFLLLLHPHFLIKNGGEADDKIIIFISNCIYDFVEGYAGFDFIINHDAKTKENAVTICNQQG